MRKPIAATVCATVCAATLALTACSGGAGDSGGKLSPPHGGVDRNISTEASPSAQTVASVNVV